MKPYINDYNDVLRLLDDSIGQIGWDDFYGRRDRPAPFILQNDKPDESLVEIIRERDLRTALELGCGEGRNAIHMAAQGLAVTALDMSPVAIENARKMADAKGAQVDFLCRDALQYESLARYDFIYDSGLFHHLTPHRRLTYKGQLLSSLTPGGYFGLTCFASEDAAVHGAEELTDWEFYHRKSFGGVSFSPERLREFFAPQFNLVSIRKMRDGVPDTIQGLTFMWAALFHLNRSDDKI